MSATDGRRVLIVSRHYAPEAAGSGPVIQTMAEWLAAQGYQTEVVTVRPSYPGDAIHPGYANGEQDKVAENGVHVRRLPAWAVGSRGLGRRILAEIRFFGDLLYLRLRHRLEPAGIVVSLCPSILAVAAARLFRDFNGNHIALVHDIPSGLSEALGIGGTFVARLSRAIERWTLNRVDHIVVLSEAMAAHLRQMGVRTPILIQPPPLDTEAIRPMPRLGTRPTVLYSGNLGRKQGLDQLLGAAVILRNTRPDLRLEIRGDGPMRDSLIARAACEGLSNIRFLPFVPKHQLAHGYAEADIHLIPQLPAGGNFAVPSKAYTIMAAGRPFIATALPGSPLALVADESGAGICVEPGNATALAEAILSLMADPAARIRMGSKGRAYVERHADTAVVINAILDLITDRHPVRLAAE